MIILDIVQSRGYNKRWLQGPSIPWSFLLEFSYLTVWDCQHWGFHHLCREDEEIVPWSEEDPQTPACSTKHTQPIYPTKKWKERHCDKRNPQRTSTPSFFAAENPTLGNFFYFSPWLKLSYIDAFSLTFELMSQMSPVNSRWACNT